MSVFNRIGKRGEQAWTDWKTLGGWIIERQRAAAKLAEIGNRVDEATREWNAAAPGSEYD